MFAVVLLLAVNSTCQLLTLSKERRPVPVLFLLRCPEDSVLASLGNGHLHGRFGGDLDLDASRRVAAKTRLPLAELENPKPWQVEPLVLLGLVTGEFRE